MLFKSQAGTTGARRSILAAARLTLMTVGASEALLALAAELTAGLAAAASMGSAHIGRDVALSSGRAVGRHRHGAAVNHCMRDRDGVTG